MRLVFLALVLTAACGESSDPTGPQWNGLGVGSACAGLGVCAFTSGFVEPDGFGGAVCSTAPGGSADVSAPERCDDEDNNCSGRIDDIERGQCNRCGDANDVDCERCESADSVGVFPTCARGFCDCDRIVGPSVEGFICGCASDLDCPCGFFCGEIPIGDGAVVTGCAAP